MNDEMPRASLEADLPAGASPIARAGGLPKLSAADLNSLAQRIALIDGITPGEAHRHIDEMLRCDL
jgi:hypothetical protein